MPQGFGRRVLVGAVVAIAAPAAADTVVLREGRRIQGDLVSIRGGEVRFEEREGDRFVRVWKIDRNDVLRVELEPGSWGGRPRGERRGSSDERWEPSDRRDPGRDRGGRDDGSWDAGNEGWRIEVPADRAWTDSGIDVRGGQELSIEAEGHVQWALLSANGPDGDGTSTRHPGSFPLPTHPGGALIGRVGRSGRPFFLGTGGDSVRMRESGRLYLGINDDRLEDNQGGFEVRVLP